MHSRCGVLVLGSSSDSPNGIYAEKAYQNDVELGYRVAVLNGKEAIQSPFPEGVTVGPFENSFGYLNYDGGWANATQGVRVMTDKVIALGGKVIPGKQVVRLIRQDGKTTGVECADGYMLRANRTILAAGSWTSSSFPELDFKGKCIATGYGIHLHDSHSRSIKLTFILIQAKSSNDTTDSCRSRSVSTLPRRYEHGHEFLYFSSTRCHTCYPLIYSNITFFF